MKLKNDFITNSSSASFILGVTDNSETIKLKVSMEYEIYEGQYGVHVAKSIHELDQYWLDSYGDIDTENEYYKQSKSIIEGGGSVVFFCASDEDGDPMEAAICQSGINKNNVPENVTIIRGEGGY